MDFNEEASFVEFLPSVDVLFVHYNIKYFSGILAEHCKVEWSNRMTLCAGICYFECTKAQKGCIIRLSRPLLQLRPFKDTINTLLHEMIHAYLFLTTRRNHSREGHGEPFLDHMRIINAAEGTDITVYHGFKDEVRFHRKHSWRCNGPCRNRHPFFGWVHRAKNRAPQPADWWWSEHLKTCGGTFFKIDRLGVQTLSANIKDPDSEKYIIID